MQPTNKAPLRSNLRKTYSEGFLIGRNEGFASPWIVYFEEAHVEALGCQG